MARSYCLCAPAPPCPSAWLSAAVSCCSTRTPCSSMRAAKSSPSMPLLLPLEPLPRARRRALASSEAADAGGMPKGSLNSPPVEPAPPAPAPLAPSPVPGRRRRDFAEAGTSPPSASALAAVSTAILTRRGPLAGVSGSADSLPFLPPRALLFLPTVTSSTAFTAGSLASSLAVCPSPFLREAFAAWPRRMVTHSAAAAASFSSAGSTARWSAVEPALSVAFTLIFFVVALSSSIFSSFPLERVAAMWMQFVPSGSEAIGSAPALSISSTTSSTSSRQAWARHVKPSPEVYDSCSFLNFFLSAIEVRTSSQS